MPRIRFGLATLFVFMLVVGTGLGWIGRLRVRASRQQQVIAQIRASSGEAYYSVPGKSCVSARPPAGPRWLRYFLPDEAFADVTVVQFAKENVEDADLAALRQLTRLNSVVAGGPHLTDRGIEYLTQVADLRALNLSFCDVTSEGLTR
jgi:hypothetical protein